MDIRTVAEIDAQTKEEEDKKIQFFEDGLWVYRKTRILYLYEIYQAYLDEDKSKSKTNRTKQTIVFKILDITGKGSVLPRQLDGCKLLYKILVKYNNENAQLIMLEMVWRKILSVADATDDVIRMSANTGRLFDSTDDNYKDKYTNTDIYNLKFSEKGNEFLNRSERNPFYYNPLVRVAIDEIINRNINKYTDLLNKQSSTKGGKKSRKQRIKSKRTGKSIKHNKN